VRVLLQVTTFARIRSWLGRTRPSREAVQPADVRRAMQRASRTVPGSSCLAQSLVAERLLREAGQPVLFTVGVADAGTAESMTLDAHAWVESRGMIVVGEGELGRYARLMTFETPA
jgi:hypothetical protein